MNIKELHNRSMELAGLADLQKQQGKTEQAISLYERSYAMEYDAAMTAYKEGVGEPSVSVLLRSAACLAISCKKLREAEILITLALSGEPPFEIAEELRALLEEVDLNRRLEVREARIRRRLLMRRFKRIAAVSLKMPQSRQTALVTVTGTLKGANADTNRVKIAVDNEAVTLKVPDGLSDIVKKYWDEKVTVQYCQKNKRDKLLIDIEESK